MDSSSSFDDALQFASNLKTSYLMSTKSKQQTAKVSQFTSQEELDDQLEKARTQVDNAEDALRALTDELDTKREQFKRDLEMLREEIQSTQEDTEYNLSLQQTNEQAELQRLHDNLEQDIIKFQNSFDNTAKQMERQRAQQTAYSEARRAWKLTDMERSLQFQQSKELEYDITTALSKAERSSLTKSKSRTTQERLRQVEDEVSQLQSSVRDMQKQTHVNEIELNTKIQTSYQDHQLTVSKMKSEMQQRDRDYARHIDSVKKQIQREAQKNEWEMNNLNEKYTNLQSVYQTQQKRGLQQIQRIASDIDKLKRALDDATRSEEQFVDKNKTANLKMQELRLKASELRNTAQEMIDEKEQLERENEKIVQELNKYDRKSHATTQAPTTSLLKNATRRTTFTRF